MKYHTILPTPELAAYVRFFWVLESDGPYIHRSLADGGVELIFHYLEAFDEIKPSGRARSSLSAIQGPSSGYQVYECKTKFGIFGIYLHPFAIPALFNIPSSEISDEMPDLVSFLGKEGRILEEQIMTATTNGERITISSKFLKNRLKKGSQLSNDVCHVIESITRTKGKIDIDRLAQDCFLSRRQFERKFKSHAGFSPKKYANIVRFQHAADAFVGRSKPLVQIALECGYYDQAHFTNHFKKFSGYQPKDYFEGKVIGNEWREKEIEMSHSSKS